MLTVHHLAYSRSTRVLWLLEEIGAPYRLVRYERDTEFRAPPELKAVHPLGKSPGEFVGDGFVHDEPVRGGACLADVPHLGEHGTVDGLVQVGVAEDNERGVAAEFHGHLEHVLGGLLDEPLTDAR